MQMKQLTTRIFRYISPLFGTRAAGMYILLFAASIGIATFIENDFGTSAAQKVIFKSWWFELLLALFGITVIVNIFRFRMIQQRKWSLLMFHVAIVVILLGAVVTRYMSYEGVMHIRENGSANGFLSSDSYLKFQVTSGENTYLFEEPVLFASLGNNAWDASYLVGGHRLDARVDEFIPNPKRVMGASLQGKPTLKLVMGGANGREEYFISEGEVKQIGGMVINFAETPVPDAFNIAYRNDSILFHADQTFTQTVMATQTRDTIHPSTRFSPLILRALYSDGSNNVVFAEFNRKAGVHMESEGPKVKNESLTALSMTISVDGQARTAYVFGSKGMPGRPETLHFEDLDVSLSYGSREVKVPFYIQLNDFIMDKYPGTNSASSYASEVTLIDETNQVQTDYRIYMNNILNYGGFRFFQSSFDRDEQGTYLSVNHDFWGTHISYFGYALLTLGMLLTFFSKNTRFYQLTQKIKKLRTKQGGTLLLFCLFSATLAATGQQITASNIPKAIVSESHAQKFSELVVQDFKGRMKPMHTLSREVMRKIARKESLNGLDAEQILLGMYANGQDWYHLPIIKLGENKELGKKISVGGNYASYADFFEPNGDYKLGDEVQRVYGLEPIDRGTYEKELLKIDERVNIMSMVFSGSLFKIVPSPDDPNNTWSSTHGHGVAQNMAMDFFGAYKDALTGALSTGNYADADRLLTELKSYQDQNGGPIMPSESKIDAEIFLNNLNIFTRLAAAYMILATALLFFLFLSVFKPNVHLRRAYLILFTLVCTGFALHTLGLGLRWYVSGRAPWSNGYESMIYIAWTTTLAGLIFTRKSFGGLAATMVLAGTILFVATLSFLDPEITPLVPVLKSYWLTIHVSMEAGSYGFLMLGAIIGLINLLLIAFITERNKERIKRMVTEMSHISELTLIGGLFMVSIGTYLGGVWANESWGRYWGWDAKETWALVTVLMYAFILHMRLIPKLKGLYAFNLATIFGLATVIMTYYGVNYYLSGLHSYATGDPVPIPGWVYVVVICLLVLSTLAYLKKRKFPIIS